ncbi:mavicyanin-like [Solanum pennellii]|uniref:Mavicyanin-like n=1 Tax=Solanum pennellii TaxID=28526 RepID=A0ABM1HM29_SOLPN|nr:mavicyanin-like [Solanum pennellii]
MGFMKVAKLFLSITVVFSFFMFILASAAVYKIGDDAGWTFGSANVNYGVWAATKKFQIDDILVFVYDKTQNNVLRVSLSDFHNCNAANPIRSYSSGNDSITIMGPGHYYYICGFPGHCQTGQKVDIRVPKVVQPSDLPTGSPSPSPAPGTTLSTTSVHVTAPAPAKSSAPSFFINNGLGLGLTLFMIVIGADYVF